MRCGCPHCEAYMIQSETEHQACVCPECGYRCNACLGTNSIITKEQLAALKDVEWFTPVFDRPLNDEEAEEQEAKDDPFGGNFGS